MRSVELLVLGVMLFFVALVPPGWQDERFTRFLPGRGRFEGQQPRPRRRLRLLNISCFLAGSLFVVAGVHSMF